MHQLCAVGRSNCAHAKHCEAKQTEGQCSHSHHDEGIQGGACSRPFRTTSEQDGGWVQLLHVVVTLTKLSVIHCVSVDEHAHDGMVSVSGHGLVSFYLHASEAAAALRDLVLVKDGMWPCKRRCWIHSRQTTSNRCSTRGMTMTTTQVVVDQDVP